MFEDELSEATGDKLSSLSTSVEYTYYLDEDISSPTNYRDLISTLENMQENDTMVLVINSGGGYLHTAISIINAINKCKGHVHGVNAGMVCSAASCIFLACDSAEVQEHTSLMAHTGSSIEMGKSSDMYRSISHSEKMIAKFYRDVYKNFFTEEEINKMLDGVDFWLNDDEISERLKKRQEIEEEENTSYITYRDLMKMSKKQILSTLGVHPPEEDNQQ